MCSNKAKERTERIEQGRKDRIPFEKMLEVTLMASVYNNIHEKLGITGYKKTRTFNDLRNCSEEFIEKIARITGKKETVLVLSYKLGWNTVPTSTLSKWAAKKGEKIITSAPIFK